MNKQQLTGEMPYYYDQIVRKGFKKNYKTKVLNEHHREINENGYDVRIRIGYTNV